MIGSEQKRPADIILALQHNLLSPLYNSFVRLAAREKKFEVVLLDNSEIENGSSVLDLGCGTGTMSHGIATKLLAAQISGLDAGPAILEVGVKLLVPTQYQPFTLPFPTIAS